MRFRTALRCAAIAAALAISTAFSHAGTLVVLHNFAASPNSVNADGSFPLSLSLSGGTLFGAAEYSGANGSGAAFELATNGTDFTDVYTFSDLLVSTSYENQDGANPTGVLVSGNTMYGTTSLGGTNGHGSIFSVKLDGTGFTNLYNFTNGLDGAVPGAGLVQIGNGLYGTAEQGGANANGTIFAINVNGSGFSVLHEFSALDSSTLANADGANPVCTLTASNGRLYGTAQYGGAFGSGTVFAINADGSGFGTLYSFSAVDLTSDANSDGALPEAGLALTNGVLFGTAAEGGVNGAGTIFSVNTDGTGFQNLHSFSALTSGENADGAYPEAELILSTNAVYGLATSGGTGSNGTVFAVNKDGTGFAVVHAFTGGSDGGFPDGNLILAGTTLFGTTAVGGSGDSGTVFALSPGPLAPPQIITNLSSQSVNAGSPVTFQVFAIGAGTITYQWYFNGAKISGATTDTLQIKKAAAANNGDYYVVVTGDGGSVNSSTATLSVLIPPVITGQPVNKTVATGGIAAFTVKATGSPLSFQWYFNGAALSDGLGYSGSTSNVLTIDPVTSATVGSYYVVVGNSETTVTSKTASLALSIEKTKPTVVITSPKAASRTNAPVLSGTASDSVRVLSVEYWVTNLNKGIVSSPLNGQAALAVGKGATTNWTIADAALLPGTNVLTVQSFNAAGLASVLEKVSFFYKVPSALSLSANGSGTFTGTASVKGDAVPADQALLNVGEGYSVTAKAGKNWLFQNWTANGVVVGTNATLSFLMESDLSLTANFVTNFFVGMAARYDGIFYPVAPQIAAETNSGLIYNLVVGTNGTYSAKVYLAAAAPYSISGSFNTSGVAAKTITRAAKSGGNIVVSLQMALGATPRVITGSVASTGWSADTLNLYAAAAAGTLADAASYTMLLPADVNVLDAPPDFGFALATNISQMIHMGGALSDGTTFTVLVEPLNELNQFPVYASLYANTGLVLGTLSLDGSVNAPSGTWLWFKPPQKSGLYNGGFYTYLNIDGSPWTNSAAAQGSMAGNYQLTFSGGGFSSDIVDNVQLSSSGALTLVNGTEFSSGTIKPANGLMSLTFTNALGKKVTASGTFLQNTGTGGGFFSGTTSAGTITLTPVH